MSLVLGLGLERQQRCSRGHKARGQGRTFRGETLSRPRPRTKDTTHKCFPKKKGKTSLRIKRKIFRKISGVLKEKKVFAQKIDNFSRNFIQKNKRSFLGLFLTNQKKVLSSVEDRALLRTWRLLGLEVKDLTFEAKDFIMCPEDVLKAKNVLRTPAPVGRKCFRFNAACLKKSYSTSNLTIFLSFETKKKEKKFSKRRFFFPTNNFLTL